MSATVYDFREGRVLRRDIGRLEREIEDAESLIAQLKGKVDALEDELADERTQQREWCADFTHQGGYRCQHCGYDWRPVTW